MAEKDPTMGGLGSFGNINTYGMSQEQLADYNDAIEKNISALEQRYAEPNWFKIAAGFAKPQLGGFLASLGSAAEAHGDTVEKQRAMGFPIAKMRTELAQTGLLLTNKKKASEIAERARRENRNLTPQELDEISNLDSERGQRLIQAQQARGTTVANNRAITEQNYKSQGLPVPPLNEMGLPETGKFPTGGGDQGNADPARILPPPQQLNPFPSYPSGAKVNDDQKRLQELGIPIISGTRTREQQQALYDNRANNPNPVAAPGSSKHETGQAIDVDTKSLSAEQRGMLKALGYNQPMPDKDPNHWEKVGATGGNQAPKEKIVLSSATPSFSPLFTSEQVKEGRGLTDKQLNEGATKRYENLASVSNTDTFTQNKNAINAMIRTLVDKPDLARAVTNPLAKQGGALGAALNAAEKGMGVSISGLAGNIHAPVQAAIIGSFDPDTERPYYDLLQSQAARIAQIQQQIGNVNPGTIRNGEIELYKNAGVSPATQGPNVMLYNLQYTLKNNEMLHEMYDRANKIMKNEDPQYAFNPNSRTHMLDIMTSPVMSDIADKYDKQFKKLDNQFLATLKGK
jgi:hypothetical protein